MSQPQIDEAAVTLVCDRMLTAAIGKDWRKKAPESVTAFWMEEVRQALIAVGLTQLKIDAKTEIIALAAEREAGYAAREHGDVLNGRIADKVVELARRLQEVEE